MSKFTFVNEKHPSKGGRTGVNCDLAVSVNKSGRKKSTHKVMHAIVFRLSDKLAKQARFIEGDRVDIGVDLSDGTGLLRRTNENRGNALGKNSGNYMRISVTMYPDVFPYKLGTLFGVKEAEVINVDEEGILFIFPKVQEE